MKIKDPEGDTRVHEGVSRTGSRAARRVRRGWVGVALPGQAERLALRGGGARLGAPLQEAGSCQPVDRRVEAAVADRAGVAGQGRDPAAQLVAVQRAFRQEPQDRQWTAAEIEARLAAGAAAPADRG